MEVMDNSYRDLVRRYCEGRLSMEEEIRLLSWIRESQENQDRFRAEEKAWMESRRMPIAAKMAVEKARKKARRGVAFRVMTAVAAAAVIIAVCLTLNLTRESNGLTRQDNKTASTIMVPASSTTQITLPDSTHVWLNAGSVLRYGRDFNSRNRDIRLEGEAYFEVSHNKALPFVVHTAGCDVTALGTRFNVYAYPGSTTTHATLLQGSVMVENNNSGILLSPGQKASVQNGSILRSEVNAEQYISWTKGEIRYDEISLGELFDRLSRLYGVEISHNGISCSGKQLRAAFSQSESLDSILQAITCLFPVSYKFLDGSYRITESE